MTERKVVVIGIDAASWDAILPFISRLPSFRMFIEKGCWGHLESCIPPVTTPAWKCYSTGKTPGKLGVYWWGDLDWEHKRFIFHDSTSFKDWEIWDYLGEYGYKVGIINMPTTYPPKKVNGFCIAGMPAENDTEYTYPKSLKRELIERFDYRIHPKSNVYVKMLGEVNKRKILNEILKLIETRFEVAKYLVDDLDFLHITIYYSDFIHHFFGDNSKIVYGMYKKIDDELKKFLNAIDLKNTYVFLMSDHGQKVFRYSFRINEWLHSKKYLIKKSNILPKLFMKLVNVDAVSRAIISLKLGSLINHIPPNVLRKLKLLLSPIKEFETLNLMDLENSVACAFGYFIHINPRYFNNDEKHRKKFVGNLSLQLKSLRNPFNEEKVFDKVLFTEEIYPEAKGRPPEIFYIPNPENHIFWEVSPFNEKVWMNGRIWKGVSDHTLFGLFGVIGPEIKRRYNINPKIIDLAPTILHIFDLPIPNDMDGRVLKEIFKKNSQLAKRPVKYMSSLKIKTKKAIEALKESKWRRKL